jgi:hypothetical protein
MANPTPTTGETPIDPRSAVLDIAHLAACQDGTVDTAIAACQHIEDLCDELLRILRG